MTEDVPHVPSSVRDDDRDDSVRHGSRHDISLQNERLRDGLTRVGTAGAVGTAGGGTAGDGTASNGTAGDHEAGDQGTGDLMAGRGSRRRGLLVGLLVFLGYLALSLLMFRRAVANPDSSSYGTSDAILFSWYLGWFPHALTNGLDPFQVTYLNAPTGVNILWSTSVPLLALPTWPVTALAGPLVAFNLLLALAPAVSGWAMYLAARRWTGYFPAAVAGLLYAFSPYVVGASYGHLHLTFAPFPPLLLLLLDDLVVRRRRPVATGALLGLAVAAQAMISEEVLAMSAIVAVLGLAVLAVRYRDQVRPALPAVARGLAVCTVVAAVLLAWPLRVQLLGDNRIEGAIQPHDVAVSDLLTFVTPTPLQVFAPQAAVRESGGFTGNPAEVSAYVGLPLLLLLLVIAVRRRRDPLVGLFVPLAFGVALLSMGPHLHVSGRVTGIPLPWAAIQPLPLLGSALPSRFSVFLFLAAGMLLAVWLDGLKAPRLRLGAAALTGVALLPLFPADLVPFTTRTPEFFTTDAAQLVPDATTALVVPYPYPDDNIAMLWQANADYRYRMLGCYCTVPGPNGTTMFHALPDAFNSSVIAVQTGQATAEQVLANPDLAPAFAAARPGALVLGPTDHADQLRILLTELAGFPGRDVGGVTLWVLTR